MSRTRTRHSRQRRLKALRGELALMQDERPEWERLLQRSNDALRSAQRLITRSYRAMRGADHAPAGPRLIAAGKRLVLVPDWTNQADRNVARAMEYLRQAIGAMALAPDPDAPALMIRQSSRLMQAVTQLSILTDDTWAALHRLRSALDAADEAAAAEKLADDERSPIAVLDPNWRHSFIGCLCLSSDRLRSLDRRRRSPLRVADAPRRISQGRAPPLAAICQPCF